jgi:hypothetical protein
MFQVSYLIVDKMYDIYPPLERDLYWDEVIPDQLPYTAATEQYREEYPQPSTANIEVPKSATECVALTSVKIDKVGDHAVSLCKYFRN